MAYYRFSSDNWKSDVYVYGTKEGVVICVAANRPVCNILEVPDIPDSAFGDMDTLSAAYRKQNKFLETCERKDIGLSCDGESYYGLSYEEALDKLTELRDEGYRVPEYVFEMIREDMKNEKTSF